MEKNGPKSIERLKIIDWLKGCAILAVVLDHSKALAEPYVVWSVNIFVLVTAAVYSGQNYVFSAKKLAGKLIYLVFIYLTAVVFFDIIFDIGYANYNRAVLSVLENPYYGFVGNPYLGDIWYITLHIQILLIMYLFLKTRSHRRPAAVVIAAAPVAMLSFAMTHFVLHRFHTIVVSSWFLYLAAGFYGLIPFLQWIENKAKFRTGCIAAALCVLVLIYSQYPLMPWLFTNNNRSTFLMLPFYTVLIFFFGELFYFMDRAAVLSRIKNTVILLGRYTLVIYMTHEGFMRVWSRFFQSPWTLSVLSVICAIFFGIFANWLFGILKTGLSKISAEKAEKLAPSKVSS